MFKVINLSTVSELNLEDNSDYLLVLDQNNFTYDVKIHQPNGYNNVIMVIDLSSDAALNLNHDVNRDCNCRYQVVSINQGVNTYRVNIDLTNPGSHVDFNLVSVCVNASLNVDAQMNNLADHSSSQMWMHGVSLDSSISFKPVGKIAKGTTGCSNYQTSRILLLDQNQHAEVDPLLLIDHFDVEAGHGASISRVSEEQLYYLQSRGIDLTTAQQLLTKGFIKPGIDVLDEQIKEPLFEIIEQTFTQ